MNTRLTVADARVALESYVRTPSEFVSQLNLVCERLIYSGKWKGNVIKVTFDSSAGFITLPPEYLSVLGAAYNRWPQPIFGEFHTYFESGPGTPWETSGWLGQLQDSGDGFCTQADIIEANPRTTPPIVAQPGAVLLYSTGSDNGKTVRIYGKEQETGMPVVDASGNPGEVLTLNAPFVQSTKHYANLTDVVKAVTNGPVSAWVLPSGGGANYQIATWLPGETRPRYRRYYTGRGEAAIQVICQRRFLPMRAETDWVIPGNLAALEFGLRAKRHEDTGFDKEAKENWRSAIDWLNQEATSSRGGAQPSVPAGVWGWMEPIPQQH